MKNLNANKMVNINSLLAVLWYNSLFQIQVKEKFVLYLVPENAVQARLECVLFPGSYIRPNHINTVMMKLDYQDLEEELG